MKLNEPNDMEWKAPPRGWKKLNFDVAFSKGKAMIECVMRDYLGIILGAWISCFSACNAFVAKAEAATQALKYATSL